MESLSRVLGSHLMHIPHPAKSGTPAYATADRYPPATGGGQEETGFALIH